MRIQDFISVEENPQQRFERLSKDKPKEEIRKLEQQLLKPDKLPPVSTEQADYHKFSPIDTRKVILVFPDDESLELFTKHFQVSKHVAKSVTNLEKLLALVELLDQGIIEYDKHTQKAKVNTPVHCSSLIKTTPETQKKKCVRKPK